MGMPLLACIRAIAASRSVFIVERKYVFSLHRAKRSFGGSSWHWHCQEDGNSFDHVGIQVRISVLLDCLCEVWLVFHQLNETSLFVTLKFYCQSLSSPEDRFCRFHKAYLVLRCWKHSALLEQDIVLKKDFLVTEACHLVLVRGDRPKENTQLFDRTSLFKNVYNIPFELLVSPCLFA